MQTSPKSDYWKKTTFLILVILTVALPVFSQDFEPDFSTESNFWLWEFLGRLHPMIVHFPVALLIFAGILELVTIRNYHSKLRAGIQMMVLAGAVSALFAAGFGLLLADANGSSGDLVDFHQNIGITTAILSLLVLFFLVKVNRNPNSPQIQRFRTTLLVVTIAVSITGHYGASLTHGEDFLTEVLPWNSELENNESQFSTPINLTNYQAEITPELEMKLIGEVRMVLAHNCYKCHSSSKTEGELRLDEKEFVFAGGESGPILTPGNPGKSELIRRINLRKGHKEVMPAKGNLLTDSEKELLELWIEKGAPWPDGAPQQSAFRVASMAPRKPILPKAKPGLNNPIDLWVDAYFEENKLNWQAKVEDRIYLRRVYLDVIGMIPSEKEVQDFTHDSNPNKREILLRNLLDRKDDFATHWLTFWNDALRNDYTGTGYITNGRFNITDWLYSSIRDNKPYDQFVTELLNPDEKSKGFIEGIRWRGTVNASQRTEMQAAQNVGQVILGLNLKCASCHDSFISDWKLEEAYAFANIFADTTLAVSRCEQPTGKMAKTRILWEELGEIDSMASKSEKLRQLADRLVQPANGRMYRTIVNRVWKQMMGRGIVEPVDEMDNQPWSQDLLDWLAVDFVENGYDLKRLIFQIASSKIYQSQSVSIKSPEILTSNKYKFEGLLSRRITAEQFSDAVSQLIYPLFDSTEVKYRPYELLPEGLNKPVNYRAALVANNPFLTALGRPNREIVSTSREAQGSLLQALELTNGERLNTALKNGSVLWKENYPSSEAITLNLYQNALNRKPNAKELEIAKKALGTNPGTEQIQDLFWAVLLLPEFQMIQ